MPAHTPHSLDAISTHTWRTCWTLHQSGTTSWWWWSSSSSSRIFSTTLKPTCRLCAQVGTTLIVIVTCAHSRMSWEFCGHRALISLRQILCVCVCANENRENLNSLAVRKLTHKLLTDQTSRWSARTCSLSRSLSLVRFHSSVQSFVLRALVHNLFI